METTTTATDSPLMEQDGRGPLQKLITRIRTDSRRKRSALFHATFTLTGQTRILDLGGANGVHVHALLSGTPVRPGNVHVADTDHAAVRSAAERFGYMPVPLEHDAPLPFADGWFDIVLCSSVLEHVTIPPQEIWHERSGARFRRRARARQSTFARELARVGRGYFVQVPYRWFPVETHTWLPLVAYLPRSWQCTLIAISNRVWIKQTVPDFHLPTVREMREYFPAAQLQRERFLGLTKSLIAIRRRQFAA
jgi:hypothetical protein